MITSPLPGGYYDDYEEMGSITALQELCAEMTQELSSLQQEISKAWYDDVERCPKKKKKTSSSNQHQTSSSNLDKAINATRMRQPSTIIMGRPSSHPKNAQKSAAKTEPIVYNPSCNFLSTRKRIPGFSFGVPKSPPHGKKGGSSASKALPAGGNNEEQEEEDFCHACDTTCWFGCECLCHEGCNEETEEEGRHSPIRGKKVNAPASSQPPSHSIKGFSFGTAPRLAVQGKGNEKEKHTTRDVAAEMMQVTTEDICVACDSTCWYKCPCLCHEGCNEEDENEGWHSPVRKQPAPTTPQHRVNPRQKGFSFSISKRLVGNDESDIKKVPNVEAPISQHTVSEPPLSTRPSVTAPTIGPPPGFTQVKPKRTLEMSSPGPGSYDMKLQTSSTGTPKFALQTTKLSNGASIALAQREIKIGPGRYEVAPALDVTRTRPVSVCIMPEPKNSSKRKVEYIEEEKSTPRVCPKGEQLNSHSKAGGKQRSRKGRKTHGSKIDSKWDDDDDSKWASSGSSDGEKGGWSSSDDKECKGKRHRQRSTSIPPKSPGSTHIGSPWSRGFRIVPDRPAGLSWRNRYALAKAREEKQRVTKLFAYQVNYELTEKGVKGGASFAAQARAKEAEQRRRESKLGLQELKAKDMKAKEAQASFVGPQLPHDWVEEDNSLKKSKPLNSVVEETIAAYGSSLRKSRKPVIRYREPVLNEAALRAKALRDAEQAGQTWLTPQLHENWDQDAAAAPDLQKQTGRDIISIEKKGVVKVKKFLAPTEACDDIGPGRYDVYPEKENVHAPDFSKFVSRADAVGPFGQKTEMDANLPMDDDMYLPRQGDILELDVQTDLLRKRVKAYSFARSGLNAATVDPDSPKDGDVLDLKPVIEVGLERKGGQLISFDKVQGRGDEFGLSSKHRGNWADFGDEDSTAAYGDALILEVKPQIVEKRSVGASFGHANRWEEDKPKDHDDIEGQRLVLSPKDHLTRKATGKGGVSMSKQPGRWDKEREDEALRKAALADEIETTGIGLQKEVRETRAIERAHSHGIVSNRSSKAPVISMSKQSNGVVGSRVRDHGEEMYCMNDEKEITAKALREEVVRAESIAKAEKGLLARRTPGIHMATQGGRSSTTPRSKQLEQLEEGQALEGEVLILEPATDSTSRMKRIKGPTDWSRQKKKTVDGINNTMGKHDDDVKSGGRSRLHHDEDLQEGLSALSI